MRATRATCRLPKKNCVRPMRLVAAKLAVFQVGIFSKWSFNQIVVGGFPGMGGLGGLGGLGGKCILKTAF